MMDPPAVELTDIHKRFGGVRALDGAHLSVLAGECHGLVGANGAGKSTLGRILSGFVPLDTGRIALFGSPVRWRGPQEAADAGVGMVPQEPLVAPNLNVVENMLLGREPCGRLGRLRKREALADCRRLLGEVELEVDPQTPVSALSVGQRQLLQLARAIARDARVLILDEPTSAITSHEAQALFRLVRTWRDRGSAIIYVSHRIAEVFDLCDRVTVMRDGRAVKTCDVETVTPDGIIAAMAGSPDAGAEPAAEGGTPAGEARGRARPVVRPERAAPEPLAARPEGQGSSREPAQAPLLAAERLSTPSGLHEVDLELRAGEIVGLAGLVGAGRSELAQALCGLEPLTAGTVRLDGRPVHFGSPADAAAAGVLLLPEDRQQQGLVPLMAVRSNLTLAVLQRLSAWGGRVRRRAERQLAEEAVARLSVRCRDVEQRVWELSGGNQQKVLLGRALTGTPRVLILDEPTRGVDVGAKADIHRWIRGLARERLAVLLISSEWDELIALADRLVVLREGRVVAHLSPTGLTEEAILAQVTTASACQQSGVGGAGR